MDKDTIIFVVCTVSDFDDCTASTGNCETIKTFWDGTNWVELSKAGS